MERTFQRTVYIYLTADRSSVLYQCIWSVVCILYVKPDLNVYCTVFCGNIFLLGPYRYIGSVSGYPYEKFLFTPPGASKLVFFYIYTSGCLVYVFLTVSVICPYSRKEYSRIVRQAVVKALSAWSIVFCLFLLAGCHSCMGCTVCIVSFKVKADQSYYSVVIIYIKIDVRIVLERVVPVVCRIVCRYYLAVFCRIKVYSL